MDGFRTNLFENSSEKGGFLITKSSAVYFSQFLDVGAGPLLPLPSGFSRFEIKGAYYDFPFNGKKIRLKCPKADEPLTEYCNQCLRTFITVEFIELVNQHSFSPSTFFKNEKLEYAISLYNTIYRLPFGTSDLSVRNTLAFYFGDRFNVIEPFSSDTQTKLTKLRDSLKSIETAYAEKLVQIILPNNVSYTDGKPLDKTLVDWFVKQNAGKVLTRAGADTFIADANREMEQEINFFFAQAQIRAVMFSADPIISDPRFRMSLEDARWNEYDETIKTEVAYYNRKFRGVGGFVPLDWRYVKAMVWTEVMAGPTNAAWQTKPMQIGVTGDPGLGVVRGGTENSNLITTDELRRQLQSDATGKNNLKAGIAYLFTIAIRNSPNQKDRVDFRDAIDDPTVQKHIIAPGETAETVAKKFKTTIGNIIKNTPGLTKENVGNLSVGQEINFQKAHSESYIVSWRDWKSTIRAYNGNAERTVDKNGKPIVNGRGDPDYLDKLNRAYQIIISRQK